MAFMIWFGRVMESVLSGTGNFCCQFSIIQDEEIMLWKHNLLAHMLTLSPRKVTEIKCNRTVNTVGRSSHNVPSDLHTEHLNRRLKFMIANLGSTNSKPQCVKGISQCLGVIAEICTRLEQEVEVQDNKDFYTFPSFEKDLSIILEQLARDDLLDDNTPRGLMS